MRVLLLLLCLFVCSTESVSAYSVQVHDLAEQYEILTLPGSASEQQIVVGELRDYPHMVELVSDEPFFLTASVRAVPGTSSPQFGGIVVQVLEPRGVAEVARLKASDATWTEEVDTVSALPYLVGPAFAGEVPAGTYRIEISTPDNTGRYILVIGNDDVPSSYGDTWSSVSTLYDFYGVSKLGMIWTPLVYYPLGIVLLLIGFGYTVYRTRDRLPFLRRYG